MKQIVQVKKMSKKKIEYRYRSLDTAEIIAENESRTIRGLAIPVNSRSAFIHDFDGDYFEIVLPEAVNEELISQNDVKIYLDHDASQGTLARSKYGKGSLQLFITERGLEFQFDAPKSVFGDAILEGIRRGDYDAVSFAFNTEDEKWMIDEETGEPMHYILKFNKLAEISILSLPPAFPVTEVELRSLEDFKKEQEAEKERKFTEALKKLDEIDEQFNKMYDHYIDVI